MRLALTSGRMKKKSENNNVVDCEFLLYLGFDVVKQLKRVDINSNFGDLESMD
jgi:hypothetical protein